MTLKEQINQIGINAKIASLKLANIDPKSVTRFSNLCEAFLEPQSTDLTQKFQRQQAPCGC